MTQRERERLGDAIVDVFREVAKQHWPFLKGEGWPAYNEGREFTQVLLVNELVGALSARGVRLPGEGLDLEARIANALDSKDVADLMGGGFESGEITVLSRYVAHRLRALPGEDETPRSTADYVLTYAEKQALDDRLDAAVRAGEGEEPRPRLDVDRLLRAIEGMGAIDNGTWVSFNRADAQTIADRYAEEASDVRS